MERIALAREYRVAEWLRNAYLELTQNPLDFEKLQPTEPYSNPLNRDWEADAKKWEATSRDWEMLAKISHLQTKVTASIKTYYRTSRFCSDCHMQFGTPYECLCKCRILALVDEVFRKELESLKDNSEHVEPLEPPLLVA